MDPQIFREDSGSDFSYKTSIELDISRAQAKLKELERGLGGMTRNIQQMAKSAGVQIENGAVKPIPIIQQVEQARKSPSFMRNLAGLGAGIVGAGVVGSGLAFSNSAFRKSFEETALKLSKNQGVIRQISEGYKKGLPKLADSYIKSFDSMFIEMGKLGVWKTVAERAKHSPEMVTAVKKGITAMHESVISPLTRSLGAALGVKTGGGAAMGAKGVHAAAESAGLWTRTMGHALRGTAGTMALVGGKRFFPGLQSRMWSGATGASSLGKVADAAMQASGYVPPKPGSSGFNGPPGPGVSTGRGGMLSAFKAGGKNMLQIGGMDLMLGVGGVAAGRFAQGIGYNMRGKAQQQAAEVADLEIAQTRLNLAINQFRANTEGAVKTGDDWVQTLHNMSKEYGRSEASLTGALAPLLEISSAMGLNEGQTEKLFKRVVDLNTVLKEELGSTADTVRAALAGNSQAASRLGASLTGTAEGAVSLEKSIAGVSTQLTQMEQVQKRYNALIHQTEAFEGASAKAADTLSQAYQRLEAAQFNFMRPFGEGSSAVQKRMLDFYARLGNMLNDVIPEGFRKTIGAARMVMGQGLVVGGGLLAGAGSLVSTLALANFAGSAAKPVGSFLRSTAIGGSGLAGRLANTLYGSRGGVLGAAGKYFMNESTGAAAGALKFAGSLTGTAGLTGLGERLAVSRMAGGSAADRAAYGGMGFGSALLGTGKALGARMGRLGGNVAAYMAIGQAIQGVVSAAGGVAVESFADIKELFKNLPDWLKKIADFVPDMKNITKYTGEWFNRILDMSGTMQYLTYDFAAGAAGALGARGLQQRLAMRAQKAAGFEVTSGQILPNTSRAARLAGVGKEAAFDRMLLTGMGAVPEGMMQERIGYLKNRRAFLRRGMLDMQAGIETNESRELKALGITDVVAAYEKIRDLVAEQARWEAKIVDSRGRGLAVLEKEQTVRQVRAASVLGPYASSMLQVSPTGMKSIVGARIQAMIGLKGAASGLAGRTGTELLDDTLSGGGALLGAYTSTMGKHAGLRERGMAAKTQLVPMESTVRDLQRNRSDINDILNTAKEYKLSAFPGEKFSYRGMMEKYSLGEGILSDLKRGDRAGKPISLGDIWSVLSGKAGSTGVISADQVKRMMSEIKGLQQKRVLPFAPWKGESRGSEDFYSAVGLEGISSKYRIDQAGYAKGTASRLQELEDIAADSEALLTDEQFTRVFDEIAGLQSEMFQSRTGVANILRGAGGSTTKKRLDAAYAAANVQFNPSLFGGVGGASAIYRMLQPQGNAAQDLQSKLALRKRALAFTGAASSGALSDGMLARERGALGIDADVGRGDAINQITTAYAGMAQSLQNIIPLLQQYRYEQIAAADAGKAWADAGKEYLTVQAQRNALERETRTRATTAAATEPDSGWAEISRRAGGGSILNFIQGLSESEVSALAHVYPGIANDLTALRSQIVGLNVQGRNVRAGNIMSRGSLGAQLAGGGFAARRAGSISAFRAQYGGMPDMAGVLSALGGGSPGEVRALAEQLGTPGAFGLSGPILDQVRGSAGGILGMDTSRASLVQRIGVQQALLPTRLQRRPRNLRGALAQQRSMVGTVAGITGRTVGSLGTRASIKQSIMAQSAAQAELQLSESPEDQQKAQGIQLLISSMERLLQLQDEFDARGGFLGGFSSQLPQLTQDILHGENGLLTMSDEIGAAFGQAAGSIPQSFASAFDQALFEGRKFSDALSGSMQNIGRRLLSNIVSTEMSYGMGKLLSPVFGEKRASAYSGADLSGGASLIGSVFGGIGKLFGGGGASYGADFIGPIPQYAHGGEVRGQGSSHVSALVRPGEHVMTSRAVSNMGRAVFDALNESRVFGTGAMGGGGQSAPSFSTDTVKAIGSAMTTQIALFDDPHKVKNYLAANPEAILVPLDASMRRGSNLNTTIRRTARR